MVAESCKIETGQYCQALTAMCTANYHGKQPISSKYNIWQDFIN